MANIVELKDGSGVKAYPITKAEAVYINSKYPIDSLLKDYVTPEMFGAVGDGVTDDTTAVTAAFDYPNVYLANTYKVTSTITSAVKNIFGYGKVVSGGSFLVCTGDVVIRDITIELPNDEESYGIFCKGPCFIDHIKITGGLKGIRISNNYQKSSVTNCYFSGMYGSTALAVHNAEAGESLFENNTVENISNNIDQDADGINYWQGEDNNHPYVTIRGNVFHNCRGRAIKASTANVLIENNYITVDDDFSTITNGFAIDVQKGCSVVRQNYINAPYGILVSIRFYDSTHEIRDNTIILSKGTRVSITFNVVDSTYTTNAIIDHNIIYGANAYSIYVTYCDNGKYVITNNIVYNRTTAEALTVGGTANTTCRFVVTDNVNKGFTYFFKFTGVINIYGDSTVRSSSTVALADLMPNVRFVANCGSLVSGLGNNLLETKGWHTYYMIYIIGEKLHVLKSDGTVVIPESTT